jgi:hypothetical protein
MGGVFKPPDVTCVDPCPADETRVPTARTIATKCSLKMSTLARFVVKLRGTESDPRANESTPTTVGRDCRPDARRTRSCRAPG